MIGCKRYCCVRHLHVHFSSQRFTSNCFPCFAFGPGGSTFSWLHVLGLCFLNGAPPPAWGLQECLREVNLMEISINSSILNIFESQLSTKRFFNNNGKKELINSSFHIDKFYIFLVFRRFPGLKSPTKSAYYVDFSFGSISCPVKKSRVQSNLPECRLVVKFNN